MWRARGARDAAEAWRHILHRRATNGTTGEFLEPPYRDQVIALVHAYQHVTAARSRARKTGAHPKPGHVRRLACELRKVAKAASEMETHAIVLHGAFAAVPGVTREPILAFSDLITGLCSLADHWQANARAIEQTHGTNPRGRTPLAMALAGDPLVTLRDGLIEIWTAQHPAGRALSGDLRRQFLCFLRSLHEEMTGRPELPEKVMAGAATRKRIKSSPK